MFKSLKNFLLALTIILIIGKIVVATAIFFYPKISIQPAEDISIKPQQLIELTNNYRLSLGLSPLIVNARLTQAAVNKARDLLTNQYFAHTSPSGKRFSQWIKDVGYDYFYVGENLAVDFTDSQALFQAWLDSPGHKDNIIKPQYQEIGLAVLPGKLENKSTIVVVQLFGTRFLTGQQTAKDMASQPSVTPSDYYYPASLWEKISSLKSLEKTNRLINCLLIVFVGATLILYAPKNKAQINIKQPIINRYQAKIFRE